MREIEKDVYQALSKNPQRLLHVINVAQVSKALSLKYGFDTNLSYLAGLMHDYSKHHNNSFHQNYIDKELYHELKEEQHLYHAISAANYFKKHYSIDNRLYNAIKNHVYGMADMDSLTKVLYIADSVYLNGKHNTRKFYQLALKDLDKAVYEISKYNISNVKRKGQNVSVDQIKTMNFYKEVNKFNVK